MAVKYEEDDPTDDSTRNRAGSSVTSLLTLPDQVSTEQTDGIIASLEAIPKFGGSGPTCFGFATKTVSGLMNFFDFGVDILAVVTFLNKKDCIPENSTLRRVFKLILARWRSCQ